MVNESLSKDLLRQAPVRSMENMTRAQKVNPPSHDILAAADVIVIFGLAAAVLKRV